MTEQFRSSMSPLWGWRPGVASWISPGWALKFVVLFVRRRPRNSYMADIMQFCRRQGHSGMSVICRLLHDQTFRYLLFALNEPCLVYFQALVVIRSELYDGYYPSMTDLHMTQRFHCCFYTYDALWVAVLFSCRLHHRWCHLVYHIPFDMSIRQDQ